MGRRVIRVERYRYRTRWAEVWAYNYWVDGRFCQYGTGLVDLRRMLRQKFPDYGVEQDW